MKINPIIYGLAVLAVFFGIILGFQAAGIWSTSGKVDPSSNVIQPLSGDPTTIKGWMTLEQITNTYNVSLSEILTQFGLPSTTLAATALNDLESDTFDTSTLIDWLQIRTIFNENEQLKNETPVPTQVIPSISETFTPEATEHTAPDRTITGKTTFQDLIDWGVLPETISATLGGPLPSFNIVIKDYATEKGLAFSDIKTILQSEVDKIQ